MAMDPYKVLGIEPGASPDDVKKAYRKKARENHPDLNPGDEAAAKRMNEVNEAYDRIVNPEKYARERRADASSPGGPYGPYGGNPYGSPNGPSSGSPYGGGQGGAYGPYDWIDLDDLFGFGRAGRDEPIRPEPSAGDPPEARRAIDQINAGLYDQAVGTLDGIPGAGRSARWYYLSAIANQGAGNAVLAFDHIRKAVQMDPGNPDYARAQRSFQQAGQAYQQESQAQGFSMGGVNFGTVCCGLLAAQMFCRPYCLGF